MRVSFVHPAGYNFCPGQPDFTLLANRMAPIGILTLSAWLDKHGHETQLVDCLGPNPPKGIEATVEKVLSFNPDFVGFSTTTSAFLEGYDIATLIKAKRPSVKTIFGAVHPSSAGAQLLPAFPNIDYLCIGEGEGAMQDLADGKPLRSIPNLVWRDGDKLVSNPRRGRITDLDTLPFPNYKKLDGFPKGYHLPLFSYRKRWGATMITSRGCPFTCSYCDRTVYERLYKYNSANYVWEHMKYLRDEFGVHHINFYDDLFTASRKRVIELCETLIKKPLGMDWNCAIRVGHNDDDELFSLMKRAGCLQVSMGIESADPTLMDRHKTGVKLEEVAEVIKRVHKLGMRAKGLFIFGLPGETPETFKTTSDWIQTLDVDEMNMTKFTPFYGAPMWHEIIDQEGKEGFFHEDWRLMNCLNFIYRPAGFESVAQMEKLYNEHVQRFYRGKQYQKRFRARIWEHKWTLWHLFKNLPSMLAAQRYFKSSHEKPDMLDFKKIPLHPAQPKRLTAGTTSKTVFEDIDKKYVPAELPKAAPEQADSEAEIQKAKAEATSGITRPEAFRNPSEAH